MDDHHTGNGIQLSPLQRAILRVLYHNQPRFSAISTQTILYDLKRKRDPFWDSGTGRNVSEFSAAMDGLCNANLVEHRQHGQSNTYTLTPEGQKRGKHLHDEKRRERQESPPGHTMAELEARASEKDERWEREHKAGIEARMLEERQRKIDRKVAKHTREL